MPSARRCRTPPSFSIEFTSCNTLVLQLDDVRPREFFRTGGVMLAQGRGNGAATYDVEDGARFETCGNSRCLRRNRRLFTVYVLCEQVESTLDLQDVVPGPQRLMEWFKALGRQLLAEMERFDDFLLKHLERTRHARPARFDFVNLYKEEL